MNDESHKVAVITGANGYLGISIAEKLIERIPKDEKLTIVVTSRTLPGVKAAVDKIKKYLNDNKVAPSKVYFDYLVFDQCNMVSMLSAAYELKKRFNYVDYLILNSSYALFTGIDYIRAFKDFFISPIESFTVGTMKLQGVGKKSADDMGAVFQANVLSPWYLINEIKPLLSNGGRVVWISSSISFPYYFDPEDIEMVKCEKAYETAKYELELLHQQTFKDLYEKDGIQMWLTHPGLFKSTTFVPTLNIFVYFGMLVMFYICRFAGSPYHCIWPEVAANAPVWACLDADPKKDDMSVKYGSACTRLGKERLLPTEMNLDTKEAKDVTEYVESKRTQWQMRLKDYIIERNLY